LVWVASSALHPSSLLSRMKIITWSPISTPTFPPMGWTTNFPPPVTLATVASTTATPVLDLNTVALSLPVPALERSLPLSDVRSLSISFFCIR